MIVRIQDNTCCELHDSQLPDVVQLLGKDSFTFRLDQAQNHLNLVLPVNDYQVILETYDDRLAVLFVYLMTKLKQARFPCVLSVHTDADRKRMIEHVSMEHPILWMTFDTESDSQEWVVHYSLQPKKTSKQLAERIVSHLSCEVAARIQSEAISWKQMVSSFRTQSERQIPRVRVTFPSIQAYTVDHMEEIAGRLAKAVVSVYTDKPLLELMQELAVLEEKAQALFIPTVTEVPMIQQLSESSESSKRAETEVATLATEVAKPIERVEFLDSSEQIEPLEVPQAYEEDDNSSDDEDHVSEEQTEVLQQELETELESESTSVSVQENAPDPMISSEQEKRMNVSIQESSVTRAKQRMSQSTAVFCMLRAHAQGMETSEQSMRTSSTSSFMAHMNQFSSSNNKEMKQQQPFNILLHQHNLNKSEHEK